MPLFVINRKLGCCCYHCQVCRDVYSEKIFFKVSPIKCPSNKEVKNIFFKSRFNRLMSGDTKWRTGDGLKQSVNWSYIMKGTDTSENTKDRLFELRRKI